MKIINFLLLIAFCVIVFLPLSSSSQEKLQVRWQKRANLISADSLLNLFSQMSPFEVFDHISYLSVDYYECFHNLELRQHLVKWLDKELYFKYVNEGAVNRIFRDENRRRNEVRGWLILNDKRVLIDTVLNTPDLYQQYFDTVINDYWQTSRETFFSRGGSLPSDVLSFFNFCKIPEAYEIIYRYWEKDGKTRQSAYYVAMLTMHDPEALQIANDRIDNVIAHGDFEQIQRVYRFYVRNLMFAEFTVDWFLKFLAVQDKINLSPFEDDPRLEVPYNIYLHSPLEHMLNPFGNYFVTLTENEIVHDIYNQLFEFSDKIYKLRQRELEAISQRIKENIHEFEKAAQPYREWLIEENRYWKEQMPYNK